MKKTPPRLPVWITVLAVLIVVIICATVTISLMRSYSPSVDTELADEVGSYQALTSNILPADSDFEATGDSPRWQLRSFGWLNDRQVTAADIDSLSPADRRTLADAILAMAGFRFKDPATVAKFDRTGWYRPVTGCLDSLRLTDIQRSNLDFINDYK